MGGRGIIIAAVLAAALWGCGEAEDSAVEELALTKLEPIEEDAAEAAAETAAPAEAVPVELEARAPNDAGAMTLTRDLPVQPPAPGEVVDLVLTLDYEGEEPVTALAIEEVLPEGWTLEGLQAEPPPAVKPKAGATGTLTFVWIDIPEWPMHLFYSVRVPEAGGAEAALRGQAIYRTMGDELRSEVAESTLALEEGG